MCRLVRLTSGESRHTAADGGEPGGRSADCEGSHGRSTDGQQETVDRSVIRQLESRLDYERDQVFRRLLHFVDGVVGPKGQGS